MPGKSIQQVASADASPLEISGKQFHKIADAGYITVIFTDDDEEESTLDLDEDTMDFIISPSSSVDTCYSQTFAYNMETYLAERRLIRLVRKRSALYNRHHRRFRDVAFKEKLWQEIAQKMSVEINKCISTWAELRYKYQRHVRRLRKYRRQVQTRHRKARARPIMLHEEELIFLYTHVAQFPLQSDRRNSRPSLDESGGDDDVTIVNTQPPIIDVDAEYSDHYNINLLQQRLIDAVRAYPQLYDTKHGDYEDYYHRGLIWSAICNELNEKGTKLMKIWLHLQTRYEWELLHSSNSDRIGSGSSQLLTQLKFLEPHIRQTPNTVCKLSLYLKDDWFDPIEHFRTMVNLINVLKAVPEFPQLIEYNQNKTAQERASYKELWSRVAEEVKCSSQRCEVTWLVLRHFYLELVEMRRVGYQLQDKWFFENIIGCLYKLLASRSVRNAQKHAVNNVPKAASQPKPNPPVGAATDKMPGTVPDRVNVGTTETTPAMAPLVTPLPMAIVYPPAPRQAKITISAIPKSSSSSNKSTNTIISTICTTSTTRTTSTINTASNTSINANSSSGAVGTTGYTLPYISAAITVVPKPPPTAAPPSVTAAAKSKYVNILPKPLALPIPATVQLATRPSVPSAPSARLIPPRSGLQVTVRAKLPLSPSVIGSTSSNPTGSSKGGATIIRAIPAAPTAPSASAILTAPAAPTVLAAQVAPTARNVIAAPSAPTILTAPAAPVARAVLVAPIAPAARSVPTAQNVLAAPSAPTAVRPVIAAPAILNAPAVPAAMMPPIAAKEPVTQMPKLRPLEVRINKTMLSSKGAVSMPMAKVTPTTFARMPPNEICEISSSSGTVISSSNSMTKSVAPSSTSMPSISISDSASRVSVRMEPAWVPHLVPSNAPKIPFTPSGVSVSMAKTVPQSTTSMLTNSVSMSTSRVRAEPSDVPPLVPSNVPKIASNPKVGKTVPPTQSSMPSNVVNISISSSRARAEPSGVPTNATKIARNPKVANPLPPSPSTMLSNAIRSAATASVPSTSTNISSKPSSVSTVSTAKVAPTLPQPSSSSNANKKGVCPSNVTPSEAEMKVEIRNHPTMGPVIYAESPAVPFLPNLTMARTALFIREVMAIPQLHSTNPDVMLKGAAYWQQISKKFHMPGKCE